MKKGIFLFLCSIFMLAAGCGNKENTKIELSEEVDTKEDIATELSEGLDTEESDIIVESNNAIFAELKDLEFYFSSGAGGWRTIVQIEADGSFWGVHSDSDMGSIGEGYPNGTYYYCEFEGKFTEPVKVNDYTYSMEIEEIHCANEPDTKEIIDETLYYYSTPYGLDGAGEVLLYLPDAPTAELPEEYMDWVYNSMEDVNAEKLSFYGLYNVTEQNGFSSYNALEDYMSNIKLWADMRKDSLENEELTQTEMNIKSQELYGIWDGALNDLWSEVKISVSEEEFEKLLTEQRLWIAEKEKVVEEAGKEFEGGSMYSLVVNMKAAEITEERVYELYELLKSY